MGAERRRPAPTLALGVGAEGPAHAPDRQPPHSLPALLDPLLGEAEEALSACSQEDWGGEEGGK